MRFRNIDTTGSKKVNHCRIGNLLIITWHRTRYLGNKNTDHLLSVHAAQILETIHRFLYTCIPDERLPLPKDKNKKIPYTMKHHCEFEKASSVFILVQILKEFKRKRNTKYAYGIDCALL